MELKSDCCHNILILSTDGHIPGNNNELPNTTKPHTTVLTRESLRERNRDKIAKQLQTKNQKQYIK